MGPMLRADLPEVQDFTTLVRASLFIPAATVSYTKEMAHLLSSMMKAFTWLTLHF